MDTDCRTICHAQMTRKAGLAVLKCRMVRAQVAGTKQVQTERDGARGKGGKAWKESGTRRRMGSRGKEDKISQFAPTQRSTARKPIIHKPRKGE